ncbi:tRNA ligase [Entomophthora muscae]|uniref:tRNA ligase n=1 Tax=Entomophthora muscae TaxID=34485 RepID=A0ACC2S6C3_9FUNG|nr:tRNA ligase [Entomophthora muscae]
MLAPVSHNSDPFTVKVESELELRGLINVHRERDGEDIKVLEAYAGWFKTVGSKKRWLVRKEFKVGFEIVAGWKFTEQYFYDIMKKGVPPSIGGSSTANIDLPPFLDKFLARGFFTCGTRVAIRGYDKFFNVGELACTQWDNLKAETTGPYEVTVKENGCIIFVSHHPTEGLLVASKHSLGDPESTDTNTHQRMGESWLSKHLELGARDRKTLERFLRHFDITLVFELCDDEFEEHVLPYPEDSRGLYLHGINYNTVRFKSWPTELVQLVAEHFGFLQVANFPQPTLDHVRKFSAAANGFLDNRAIEGFVVRCSSPPMLFKIKYDHPYLMFREWREITRRILTAKNKGLDPPILRKRYPLTHEYVNWVQEKINTHPKMFGSYLNGKGIVHTRNQFFTDTNFTPSDIPPTANDAPTWDRLLIVPVATIGCGKSVLGAVLSKAIDCVVIQRDDFKDPSGFHASILSHLEAKRIVFADRNNHIGTLRETLTSAVLAKFPSTAIVAIEWDVKSEPDLFNITYRNVLQRGINHPTLTPTNTHDLERVMSRFIDDFEPVDANVHPGDANFTHHVRIPLINSLPAIILSDIIPALPLVEHVQLSVDDLEKILASSLESQTQVAFKGKKVPASALYIGITLACNVFSLVFERLCSKDAPMKFPRKDLVEAKAMLQKICEKDVVFTPGSHHVTLTHHSLPILNNAYVNDGPASSWLGTGVQVTYDRIVWQSNAIIALSVKCLSHISNDHPSKGIETTKSPDFSKEKLLVQCDHLHTTLGVLDNSYVPSDSNKLLTSYFGSPSTPWAPKSLELDPPITATGRIKFYPGRPPKKTPTIPTPSS